MSEQSGERETYSLREWLGRLSQGLGLRDSDIKSKLGVGLRRLLDVENREPSAIVDAAVDYFDELLNALAQPTDQIAGKVTLNIPPWPELEGKKLSERQKWLGRGSKTDVWSGSSKGKPKPVLPEGTTRHHMNKKVVPYLEEVILARWHQEYPDEPFPLEVRPRPQSGRKQSRATAPLRVLESRVSYVPRPQTEAALMACLSSEDKLVAVHGDSGAGKSRLTAEVLMSFCNENDIRLIVLDAATPYLLFDAICDYLDRMPATADIAKVKFDFLLALRKSSHSTILFIDNVSDWESVEDLVSAAKRCVITTDSYLVPAERPHSHLRVEGMAVEEGAQLIRSLRSRVDDSEVVRLWDAVAGKPQLLIDVLGMGGDMTVDEICDCFDSDSSQIPQTVGKGTRSVEKQYRRYYEGIQVSNPLAALLLAVIVYVDQPIVSLDIVRVIWERVAAVLGRRLDAPVAEAKLLTRMIEERSLLKLYEGRVETHQLTRRIFRSIEDQYGSEIFRALFDVYLDQLEVVESEDVLARDSLEWVPLIRSALLALSVGEILAKLSHPLVLNVLITTACTGCYQLGDFLSPVVILNRFVTDDDYARSQANDPRITLDYVRQLFELGEMSRTDYAANLEANANAVDASRSPRDLGLHLMMLWDAARARYEYQEVRLASDPYILNILENGTEEDQRGHALFEIMYMNVRSFEQLGYVAEAMQGYVGYARDTGTGMSTIRRLRAAADGCRASSKLWLPSWCDACLDIARECHDAITERTDVLRVDALYALAQAWRRRLTSFDSIETPTKAVELFSEAGGLFLASGRIRDAFAAYVEGIALMYWSRVTRRGETNVPGFSDPGHFLWYAYRFANEVDEPHLMYRLALLSKLQKWFSRGVELGEVDYVLRIGEEAAKRCQDFRTYQQALLGAALFAPRVSNLVANRSRLEAALDANIKDEMRTRYFTNSARSLEANPGNVFFL